MIREYEQDMSVLSADTSALVEIATELKSRPRAIKAVHARDHRALVESAYQHVDFDSFGKVREQAG